MNYDILLSIYFRRGTFSLMGFRFLSGDHHIDRKEVFFMQVNESSENYLETILVLSKRNPVVRSVDIAEELGFKNQVSALQ